jgi:hypothetical protein
MTIVAFTKGYSLWNTGETAGFPDGEAARLVESLGVAEYVSERPDVAPDPVIPEGSVSIAPVDPAPVDDSESVSNADTPTPKSKKR